MKTVFVVDSCEVSAALVERVLEDTYNVISLISTRKMFMLLEKIRPDIILLGVTLPDLDEFKALERLKLQKKYRNIPVIVLSEHDENCEITSFILGAMEYIAKPFSDFVLCHRVNLCINLDSMIQDRIKQYKELQNNIIYVLAHMIESRDGTTGEHVERSTEYVKLLLDAMLCNGIYINEIVEWDMDTVVSSARLHDIGKIAIPDGILNKPAKLTEKEYEIVKTHAEHGARIIRLIMDKTEGNEFLHHAKLFVENHHEKWDGSGYPKGLAKQDIPLHGRIMAIADVYDALTSVRPYKEAKSHEEAMAIIKEERGRHFDPKIVDIFLKMQDQLQKHLENY